MAFSSSIHPSRKKAKNKSLWNDLFLMWVFHFCDYILSINTGDDETTQKSILFLWFTLIVCNQPEFINPKKIRKEEKSILESNQAKLSRINFGEKRQKAKHFFLGSYSLIRWLSSLFDKLTTGTGTPVFQQEFKSLNVCSKSAQRKSNRKKFPLFFSK